MSDLETTLDKSFTEMCDVRDCGQPGVGHMVVGKGAKIWLCEEHEV